MPMEIAGLEVERVTSGAPARARPILFLHGMWGGSWMWDHYLSFFAGRGYTGYALNLRGHHGSKPVDDIGRVPFADYLDDARAVAASIGDPIIVGHSMGGLLAQKLAELGDPPAVVALTPAAPRGIFPLCTQSEEHTSELQSQSNLVCRLLLEKKKTQRSLYRSQHLADLFPVTSRHHKTQSC